MNREDHRESVKGVNLDVRAQSEQTCKLPYMDREGQSTYEQGSEICCLKILDLPQKMSPLGVIRLIKMNTGMVDSERSNVKVLWVKSYHVNQESKKTEACVLMPERLASKMINMTGSTIDGIPIKVRRVQVCRYHGKIGGCRDGNCQFFHPNGKVADEDGDSTGVVRSNRSCWYEVEERCPFGKNCFFQHKNCGDDGNSSVHVAKNSVNRMVSGI